MTLDIPDLQSVMSIPYPINMFHKRILETILKSSVFLFGASLAVGENKSCASNITIFPVSIAYCHSKIENNNKDERIKQSAPTNDILKKIHDIEDDLSLYRPDMAKFERIDQVIFEEENFKDTLDQHAIYSSLNGKSRIEAYEIYRSNETEEIYCIIRFGDKVNGWPNVVHGGITALVIDNSYGWLFTAFKKPKAVTANLNINYRRPIFANSCSILRAKINKIEGKKLYMSAIVQDAHTKAIQAESTTLFIFMN